MNYSKKARELILLKEQFQETKEGFKLINIIKGTFKKAVSSPDLKTDAFNAAIGLTTGILAKKLMIGKTINPFKKLLGIIVEMTVANKVAKNADDILALETQLANAQMSRVEMRDPQKLYNKYLVEDFTKSTS